MEQVENPGKGRNTSVLFQEFEKRLCGSLHWTDVVKIFGYGVKPR